MIIRVYLRSEVPSTHRPQHSASKSLALLILSYNAARWTDKTKTTIQLTTNETWRECKDRCRRVRSTKCTAVVQDSGYDHPWSWRP